MGEPRHAIGVRILSGDDAGATRRTAGRGNESVRKSNSVIGKSVNMRGTDISVAAASEVSPAEVVGDKQKNIRSFDTACINVPPAA
jgi:hypothetical protein